VIFYDFYFIYLFKLLFLKRYFRTKSQTYLCPLNYRIFWKQQTWKFIFYKCKRTNTRIYKHLNGWKNQDSINAWNLFTIIWCSKFKISRPLESKCHTIYRRDYYTISIEIILSLFNFQTYNQVQAFEFIRQKSIEIFHIWLH